MTEVIVRYGCDGGCGRYFENKDDLAQVDIQQLRGLNNGQTIYFTERYELWCPECEVKKREGDKGYLFDGPSRTSPGFRMIPAVGGNSDE